MSLRLALAVVVYSFATILWIIALRDLPLRAVYPFAALALWVCSCVDCRVGWGGFGREIGVFRGSRPLPHAYCDKRGTWRWGGL